MTFDIYIPPPAITPQYSGRSALSAGEHAATKNTESKSVLLARVTSRLLHKDRPHSCRDLPHRVHDKARVLWLLRGKALRRSVVVVPNNRAVTERTWCESQPMVVTEAVKVCLVRPRVHLVDAAVESGVDATHTTPRFHLITVMEANTKTVHSEVIFVALPELELDAGRIGEALAEELVNMEFIGVPPCAARPHLVCVPAVVSIRGSDDNTLTIGMV